MSDTRQKLVDLASAAFDAAWDLSGEGYNGEYLHASARQRFIDERAKAIIAVVKQWEESQ